MKIEKNVFSNTNSPVFNAGYAAGNQIGFVKTKAILKFLGDDTAKIECGVI